MVRSVDFGVGKIKNNLDISPRDGQPILFWRWKQGKVDLFFNPFYIQRSFLS